ncbi:protein jim lovell-like [Prorops nasuta]|uniref:protein jim lovell-like n=1 Tax=Prorops nasuta TaxID=863751 RepID=UPI0034CE83AC
MGEETIMTLKWKKFSSHLADSVDNCYEKQQFVDLSLVCKDGTILKCHKMVLANSSSFFRRLLMANEHPHPMIILHDIEADDLKTLINFMYCGEIEVLQSEVKRLVKLAEILEVAGLRHINASALIEDTNNSTQDTFKRSSNVSRLKVDETKPVMFRSAKYGHVPRPSSREMTPASKCVPTQSSKVAPKFHQETLKSKEEVSITASGQRLETGNSGITITDIKHVPSTSRGLPRTVVSQKRKENTDPTITWPRVLSSISKDNQFALKKLCVMDEVEISAGKPNNSSMDLIFDHKQNETLDRRKTRSSVNNNQPMKHAVFIKDEIDISSEMDEDTNMDPLGVEDMDINISDNTLAATHILPSANNIKPGSFDSNIITDYPSKDGSNG